MSLARGLERRLERLVDGFAARLFGGAVHPVELGERLVREADLGLVPRETGPVAPNDYLVHLGGVPADSSALGPLQRELEQVIEITAVERGWRLDGSSCRRAERKSFGRSCHGRRTGLLRPWKATGISGART